MKKLYLFLLLYTGLVLPNQELTQPTFLQNCTSAVTFCASAFIQGLGSGLITGTGELALEYAVDAVKFTASHLAHAASRAGSYIVSCIKNNKIVSVTVVGTVALLDRLQKKADAEQYEKLLSSRSQSQRKLLSSDIQWRL